MVRKERLELSHLAAPEPKSGASTNSATSATYSVVNLTIGKVKITLYLEAFKKQPSYVMVATTGFEPVTPSL